MILSEEHVQAVREADYDDFVASHHIRTLVASHEALRAEVSDLGALHAEAARQFGDIRTERDVLRARVAKLEAELAHERDVRADAVRVAHRAEARVAGLEAVVAQIESLTWDPAVRGLGMTLPREITPSANRILRAILAAAKEPNRLIAFMNDPKNAELIAYAEARDAEDAAKEPTK